MRIGAYIAVAAFLQTGCNSHAPQPHQDPPKSENVASEDSEKELEGFVLLPSDASLYQGPDPTSYRIPGSPAGGDLSEARVYRVRSQRGSWVEVENVQMWRDEHRHHCYSRSESDLFDTQLRFWVQSTELLSVTAGPVVIESPDGGHIALRAGAAVIPRPTSEEPTRHLTELEGFRLFLPIEADKVGKSYAKPSAGPVKEPSPRATTYSFAMPFRANATSLKSHGLEPLERSSPSINVEGPIEGRVAATVSGSCLDLSFRVDASALVKQSDMVYGGILGSEVGFKAKVAEGATIYWRGGDVAGLAGQGDMRIEPWDQELAQDRGRRCFARGVRKAKGPSNGAQGGAWMPRATLELCFDPKDLIWPSPGEGL